ncbi:MAG: hypothetical protein ACOYW3_15665 [Bacteroidota bacterium]
MKQHSQTYSDYKVIKETVLDGVWKISMDSVAALEKRLNDAEASIQSMGEQIKQLESQASQRELASQQMEFDSTHINLLGLDFSKAFFLILVGVVFAALLVLLGSATGAVKLLRRSIKEKELSLFGLTAEFDEFRKKALEKEVKLSRELQNERNKLIELKGGR